MSSLPSKITFLCGLLLMIACAASTAQEEMLSKLDPFLADHCYECHDDLTAEGDLDLTSLDFDPTNPISFDRWDQIYAQVKNGEMPPKDEPQPESTARQTFLDFLEKPMFAADQADLEKYGRVHGRRLTRLEYEYTLHDLLGIDIPLAEMLPADPASHGFETVADVQQLSHFHLDKYLKAADAALDEAFDRALKGDASFKKFVTPGELTKKGGGNYRGPDLFKNGKIRTWRLTLQFFGRMPKTAVPESGWYRVTVKNARAINPGEDEVVWGSMRSGACSSADPMLFYVGSLEAGKKPKDHTFDAWIREDHMLEFKVNEATAKSAPSGATGGNVSFKGRDLEKDGFAGIEFDGIEIERIYPNGKRWTVRQRLFPGVKYENGTPQIDDEKAEMTRLIKEFSTYAFRRPVPDEQVKPYLELAAETLKKRGRLPQALRVGYRAILCSPRFLSFVEAPGDLDDFALASRLSYMLWCSQPDDKLRSVAGDGKLREPEILKAQVNRMLEDPKSERFIASFTDQWLNLKEIGFTTPDPRRYKEFDPIVQDSMVAETRAFVAELFRKNLGVSNFISSDFSMLNTRLKTHYRLKDAPVKPGEGLQRVSLPADWRSGLMTQGSVLKVTADGSITSPILRGIWVNERILGKETPPPPPNVPVEEPDIRGTISIRDQLAKHSEQEACASCHAKIDPAGFALENFDPIGQWRTAYASGKNAAKVDPTGVTPEGEPFQNVGDWKAIHLKQPDMLANAFARHLLTYATGASTRFSDQDHLEKIVAAAKADGYGLRTLLHASVASPVFQQK